VRQAAILSALECMGCATTSEVADMVGIPPSRLFFLLRSLERSGHIVCLGSVIHPDMAGHPPRRWRLTA
jgi:sugar-specific transcriptional regulator TrmB